MEVDKDEEKEDQETIDIINEYNWQFDRGGQYEIRLQDM